MGALDLVPGATLLDERIESSQREDHAHCWWGCRRRFLSHVGVNDVLEDELLLPIV